MPPDRVRLVRDGTTGIEAIQARFAGHAYDLHRHDDWLVGVTDHGVQDFFCRGARRRSTPGRVILIEPQEAHDGQAGAPGGFSYRMLYLPRAWVKAELADGPGGDPGFPASLADDPLLAREIRRACNVLGRPPGDGLPRDGLPDGGPPRKSPPEGRFARNHPTDDRLPVVRSPDAAFQDDHFSGAYATNVRRLDCLLVDAALDAVMRLLRPHLGRSTRHLNPEPPRPHDQTVARRARERLHDAPADSVGADALARAAGAADRFQLARAFRAAYGTSAHVYLVQHRLLLARRLLERGEAPASVAAACGFSDQSHLGRWFRRAYGVTPAAYRACCTNVPDPAVAIS